MGPVQLDGLFKPARLDLVVRTETGLSDPMRQVMRQTYAEALRAFELTGELSFQNEKESFVKIIQAGQKVGLFT